MKLKLFVMLALMTGCSEFRRGTTYRITTVGGCNRDGQCGIMMEPTTIAHSCTCDIVFDSKCVWEGAQQARLPVAGEQVCAVK